MSRSLCRPVVVAGFCAALFAGPALADTFGKLEHVRVFGGATTIEVTAKLGEPESSLHAVDVKYFQHEGDTWVRFTVDSGSVLPGNRVTLERAVLKDVKIKQLNGSFEHRPLVEIDLCLGDRNFKSKVSVSDRTGYTAPLLIGTADMAKLGAVDAARQFTHEPNCKPLDPSEAVVEKGVGRETGDANTLPVDGANADQGRPAVPSSKPHKAVPAKPTVAVPAETLPVAKAFRCDARKFCSQMTSCDEAKYFLAHCPGVQMDGDGNGIPCEKQWCR